MVIAWGKKATHKTQPESEQSAKDTRNNINFHLREVSIKAVEMLNITFSSQSITDY